MASKSFSVAVCFALCQAALTAGAETYDAWERGAGIETGRVSVVYAPWWGFSPQHFGATAENTHGGYEGELLLHAAPEALQHLPLRLRVRYSGVQSDEIVTQLGRKDSDEMWHQTGGFRADETMRPSDNRTRESAETNFTVRVKPDVPIRETLSEMETVLPALTSDVCAVRFGFPNNSRLFMVNRGMNFHVIVARYEVLDAIGRVLARGIVPRMARVSYGTPMAEAWVMGDIEADRLLRERCGLNAVETVAALPAAPAAYEGLHAIWVSQSAWDAAAANPRFWQRMLLQGVSLYGRPDTVRAMRAVLDPESNGVVLAAQLAAPTATVGQAAARSYASACGSFWGLDLKYETGGFEKSALDNVRPLFQDATRYQAWTAGVLGLFTVGTVVLLALAFLRLPGPKRLTLWWALPLWAALFALLGGGVGRLVLARQARADVTEYRYAHLNWPEMYCQAAGRMLRFDGRECAWQVPAGAVESPNAPVRASDGAARQVLRHDVRTPDAVRMADERVVPGTSDNIGASWFRPCALPFAVVATPDGRRLRADADLAAVYVWAERHWRKVGNLPSGREVNPLAADVPRLERVPGLPAALAGCWSKGASLCATSNSSDCDDPPTPACPCPAAAGTWLVVALQRSDPDMRPLDAHAAAAGRVVWIVQCP